MIKLKFAVIFIIAILATSVLGIATLYSSEINIGNFQRIDKNISNPADSMATLTEDDIIVDASVDDMGSNVPDTSTIDVPVTDTSINDASVNSTTMSLDEAKSNSIVTNSKIVINNPVDSTKQIIYGGTSPQCKTVTTITPETGGNSTSNSTIINNDDFVLPTFAQLASFLVNDNTDALALPDNTSVVQVAKNACANKFHNEIVVLVFSNGQVYAVNRFPLNDGTFAYVDCAKLAGVSSGTQNMDRILSVHRNVAVTATSPYQASVVYNYPTINMIYGIPMWSI